MKLNFDTKLDFFSLHPSLSTAFPGISSDDMWVGALYGHPDSPFYSFLPSDRVAAIISLFPSYNSEKIQKISPPIYKKLIALTKTKVQTLFEQWARKLEEREQYIDSHTYSEDTYEMLDKMMVASEKIWKQFFTIKKMVSDESDDSTFGDQEESLSEQGLI